MQDGEFDILSKIFVKSTPPGQQVLSKLLYNLLYFIPGGQSFSVKNHYTRKVRSNQCSHPCATPSPGITLIGA